MTEHPTKESGSYVLREVVASKRRGKPLWFASMTAVGPMTTPDIDDARKWERAEDALRSPAMLFPLTSFEVEECPE